MTTDRPRLGTPQWWDLRTTENTRSGGPGRPPLQLDQICAAALEILDRDGLDALSMRTLAQHLGSSTSTLYRQLPAGKDELSILLVDRIMGEMVVSMVETGHSTDTAGNTPDATGPGDGAPTDWRAFVESRALIAFTVFCRHPHAAVLFTAQTPSGPMAMLRSEASLQALVAFGFPPAIAIRIDSSLSRLIIGYALQLAVDEPDEQARIREYLETMDPERFPVLHEVADVLQVDLVTEFRFAVRAFVAGLAPHRLSEP
ncbi:TetR/AcrR family transcriptional regulator [Gordonia soli]|uniref:Putative TetR family transcriptional regulator n=1 Tax=Gordonia soli NBRC 108243 TaxID=1223545 RepID=M0QFI2_9ACTN|nr:TetR/AcrR family transcriptional regulator [Gordonia soli]GAC67219.1 putative TetR family transcriptional regulator [Gordonia soli NBRC 108243]